MSVRIIDMEDRENDGEDMSGSREFMYLLLGKMIVEEQVRAADSGEATQGASKTNVKKKVLA
jgi:hypothetical protein